MEKLDNLFIYDNSELKVLVINKYKNEPYILYEKLIEKFRINDLKKNTFLDKLKQRILAEKKFIKESFNINLAETILLYNPQKLYVKELTIEKNFEETTVVNEEDIKRMIKKGLNENLTVEGFSVADYKVLNTLVNSNVEKTAVGKEAEDIKLTLEAILVDSITKDEIFNLLRLVNIKIRKSFVADYYVSKGLTANNVCLIDLNYQTNKVFLKHNDRVQINYLNTGIGTILEKVYELLSRSYDSKIAEEITRIVKKYWLLKKNTYQYDIIKDVDISVVSEVVEQVITQYFALIFSKIPKEIEVEKVYINAPGLPEKELISVLDENNQVEILPMYKNNLFISSIIDKKLSYCIKKMFKEMI